MGTQNGAVCPNCGGAGTVQLAQSNWLQAVPLCRTPGCLYPLLGTNEAAVAVAPRPYVDMDSGTGQQQEQEQEQQEQEKMAKEPTPQPEDVYVSCLQPGADGAQAAALATLLFSRTAQRTQLAPDAQGFGCARRAYDSALRLARASLRPLASAADSGAAGARVGRLCIDASKLALVAKALQPVAKVAGRPLSLFQSDSKDELYFALRQLLKGCPQLARRFQSVFTLRQVCTVCFRQHVSRQRCTLLRISQPSGQFDLYDPAGRVFLRPCHHCGATDQRVLLEWRRSSSKRPVVQDALLLESADGLAAPRPLLIDNARLLPTVVLQRASPRANAFIAWVYCPQRVSWMRLDTEQRVSWHAYNGGEWPGSGTAAAVLFERTTPTEAAAAPAAATVVSASASASSLGAGRSRDAEEALDTDRWLAELLELPAAADAAASASTASPPAPTSAASEPPATTTTSTPPPLRGYVMSRFLADNATASSDEHHLAGYAEDAASHRSLPPPAKRPAPAVEASEASEASPAKRPNGRRSSSNILRRAVASLSDLRLPPPPP